MLYRYLPRGEVNLTPVAPTQSSFSTGFSSVSAAGATDDYSKVAIYGYTGSAYRIYYFNTQTGAIEQNTNNLVNLNGPNFTALAYTADGQVSRLVYNQTQGVNRYQIYSANGSLIDNGPTLLFNVYGNGRQGTTGTIITASRAITTDTVRDNLNTVRVTLPSARSTCAMCSYAPNRMIVFYSASNVFAGSTTEYVIYNTQNWSVVSSGILTQKVDTAVTLVVRVANDRVVIVTRTNNAIASYIGVYSISDTGVALIGDELPVVADGSSSSLSRPNVAVHLGPNKDHIYYENGQSKDSNPGTLRDRIYGTASNDKSTPTAPLSGLFKITEQGLIARKITINYQMSGSQIEQSQIAFAAPNGDLLIVGTFVRRFDMSLVI